MLAVIGALIANGLITVLKFIAAVMTGSSGMMAESLHSLAPKQILVNAHVNLKAGLTNEQIIQTIAEIEKNMKEAEPKVDMIFLETASVTESKGKEQSSQRIQ